MGARPQFRCTVCECPVHDPKTHVEYAHHDEVESLLTKARAAVLKSLTLGLIRPAVPRQGAKR
jgi:hypothetical protein